MIPASGLVQSGRPPLLLAGAQRPPYSNWPEEGRSFPSNPPANYMLSHYKKTFAIGNRKTSEISILCFSIYHHYWQQNKRLKGLSYEIDFKNVDENGQILALLRAAAGF